MKEIAGATGFGVIVLGTSLTLGLTMKNESKPQEFDPAVFYTVWPVLIVLLAVVFGVLLKKMAAQTESTSKRVRLVVSLALVCLMGVLSIIYPTTWAIESTKQRALASLILSMVMLMLSIMTAFLAASVKKGLGAALAPHIAWLVVATNLALNTWRKELDQNEK
jgi:tryptophan-rich sensory protein